jgi:hypothetical protein
LHDFLRLFLRRFHRTRSGLNRLGDDRTDLLDFLLYLLLYNFLLDRLLHHFPFDRLNGLNGLDRVRNWLWVNRGFDSLRRLGRSRPG